MRIEALVEFEVFNGGHVHQKVVEFECESKEAAEEIINNAVATQDGYKYKLVEFL